MEESDAADRELIERLASQAQAGDLDALVMLGIVLEQPGRGGRAPDPATAAQCYRLAAESGHAKAAYLLGNQYENGEGVERDPALARQWLLRGAERGDRDAQMNLGVLLSKGRGGPVDHEQAAHWYLQAAKQGDAQAATNLALLHVEGRLAKPDLRLAERLLLFAGQQLDGVAHLALTQLHRDGLATTPSAAAQLLHTCIAALLLPEGSDNHRVAEALKAELTQGDEEMLALFQQLALGFVREHGGTPHA